MTQMNMLEQQNETLDMRTISLSRVIKTIKHWWYIIVISMMVFSAGAMGINYYQNSGKYESTYQLLISPGKNRTFSNDEVQADIQLLDTISDLIKSDAVLRPAAQSTGTTPESLQKSLTISTSTNSLLVTLHLQEQGREQTRVNMDNIRRQSQSYINRQFPQTRLISVTPSVTVSKVSLHVGRTVSIGALVGLLAGILLCLPLPVRSRHATAMHYRERE